MMIDRSIPGADSLAPTLNHSELVTPATNVCWFVRSLPDDQSTRIRVLPDGSYTMLVSGSANVSPYVKFPARRHDILLPSSLPSHRPSLIFNEISSAETHAKGLRYCQRLVERFRCAVINAPERILESGRHKVARQLQGISKVRVPQVICCRPRSPRHLLRLAQQAGIELPVLVRETVTHNGQGLIRIKTLADRKRLNRFPFDGRKFYVTEFIDTCDTDGLYRKYRAIVVDGQPFLRHVLASERWKVVSSKGCDLESHPDRLAYERTTLDAFPGKLSGLFNTIYERIGLDYFAIDFHVDQDGLVTLFEANANADSLTIVRQDVEGQKKVVGPIVTAIEAMIVRRMDMTYHNSTRNNALSLRLSGHYQHAIQKYRLLGRLRANPLTDLAAASVCPAVFTNAEQMQQYTRQLETTLADYQTRKLNVSIDDLVSTDPFPAFNLHFQNDSLLRWKSQYGDIFERAIPAEPCKPRNHLNPRIGIVIAPSWTAPCLV